MKPSLFILNLFSSCSGADEQDEDEQDEDEEGDEKRDHGKSRKYKRLLDAKAIPAHIIEMIDVESKKAEYPRKAKTELINKLFTKDKKGNLNMVANQPIFENYKEAYHKRYGREEQQGKPRTVFLWSVFQGNEEALKAAIHEGAVSCWVQDGQPYCGFKATTAGVEKASSSYQKLSGGGIELKNQEYNTLSKTFASMAWEFGSGASGSGGHSGQAPEFRTPEKRQKTIENVGLTTEMIDLITDAKNANQRLETGCLKLLSKCTDEVEKKKFKATVLEIKDWISQNESILTWKELPNDVALTPTNFQVFMGKQADATCRLSEQFEQFKALLKARKEL